MAVVDVQGVTVRYGSMTAVDNASFSVEAGQTVALVGANGAGKTSTIGALLGTIPRAAGSVSIAGRDPVDHRADLARTWGVMPQTNGLPMGLKVGECVRLFADLYGSSSRVERTLSDCGLVDIADRRWRTLSGGELQRLSLAVALVGGRDLLVLDEPTAALDVPGQERVLELISERSIAGSAVLLTSHRFDEVERIAERVVVLDKGRVAANAPVASLTNASPEIRLGGLTEAQATAVGRATGLELRLTTSGEAVAPVPLNRDPQTALQDALNWCSEHDVSTASASVGSRALVDVYRELVGE